MRRSAWIFLAAIFLPSLGLAWLAVHSVRDQQVVLEHQQAIISQNMADALAKSVQAQMDQVRADFVATTQQLLGESKSPQILAQNFNRQLHDAWPMAEIGFAVNLDGEIYSPKPTEGGNARTFRDENDRFLSNRENVVVYSSNLFGVTQNSGNIQGGLNAQVANLKYIQPAMDVAGQNSLDSGKAQTPAQNAPMAKQAKTDQLEELKDADLVVDEKKANVAGSGAVSQADSIDVLKKETARSAQAAAGDASFQKKIQNPQSAQSATGMTSSAPTGGSTNSSGSYSENADTVTATSTVAAPTAAAAPAPASTTVITAGSLPATSPVTTRSAPANPGSENASQAQAGSGYFNINEAQVEAQVVSKVQRQVIPQQNVARDMAPLSNTVPEESDFRRVMGGETSGTLARFLENKLRLMVWSHAPADSPIVFGAQLDQGKLVEALKASFQIPELTQDNSLSRSRENREYCVAILDDTGHPVALSIPGFQGDWKHPFVATEIGEALPHWEAALYLVDPQQISRAARTLQATLGLLVLLLVAAIVSGGSLIAADVRRQVRLAQQKTDFVSNVSHELKTPLTSIRMFADLLAEKRVPDEERQATYLRIIAAEAARLTRLINNVLDFARLERGAPLAERRACDLVEAARDVLEMCGPHLEAGGISFRHEIEAETLPIIGDRDALAQIILNLVSNAEKYGGNEVLVRVRRQETAGGALACVDVLDRGAGIPAEEVKTIFEPFHRLDDSLSSGIPGSGLGLTLARRMARAHGGDVTYSARAGGGSCFTLAVPLSRKGANL